MPCGSKRHLANKREHNRKDKKWIYFERGGPFLFFPLPIEGIGQAREASWTPLDNQRVSATVRTHART